MPGVAPTFTLNEAIIQAVSRLVDDAGDPREPSHSDLEAAFWRADLTRADPHRNPRLRVGKQRRVRLRAQLGARQRPCRRIGDGSKPHFDDSGVWRVSRRFAQLVRGEGDNHMCRLVQRRSG